MAFICPRIIASGTDAWHQRLAKLGSEALLLLCVQLLMLSYMLLPDYANEGSLVDKKDLEAKYSVPNNVVALLFLPVYSAVMMSYQQDFLTSVVYIAAFTLTVVILALIPNTKTNGYPAEGVTFLGYSMIFALKAFMGERSHRQQFRGRHAIDEAKRNIEGILETMMPQQVFEELQRLPAGSTAPSHHYFRATLVQSDLTGFTAIASQRAPEWVVKAVSDLFGMYDSLAEQHGIYKLETVGDAYLAGQAEPPLTHENHPPSVVSFGLKMVEAVRQWSAGSGVVIGVRVGVHTGECVGGIVGIDAQRYHLFGKLLHELEILESTAPENGCQVSLPCKSVVGQSPDFVFLERREPHLTTSKGEVHHYSEVHGRSFIVQATS